MAGAALRCPPLLLLTFAALPGCGSCDKAKSDTAPSAQAPATGPVIASADGGVVATSGAISEEIAGRNAGPIVPGGKLKAATPMAVQCKAPAQAVSPTIFGIAFADADPDLGATAHRWGGNTTTRYNPKLGNAWSTANDWFFENVEIDSWEKFVDKAAAKGGRAAITVPIMGWVAKDTTGCAFPKAAYPSQEAFDTNRPQCGNGKKPGSAAEIDPPKDPSGWSVRLSPEEVGAWVARIRAADEKRAAASGGKRVVYEYILDNEPGLWGSSHRDVHPEPTSYDELLEKTIAYGTAVRNADPKALIAGPAEWGGWGYFFSAKDHKAGFTLKPDRRAHGDEPLLGWYLRKLAEHERKTGTRVLDVLDVHFYPQGDNVQGSDGEGGDGGGATDRATNDLRFRTTRSLWDREYKDESWMKDLEGGRLHLLTRMKDLIAQSYPGIGLQIGEYNFGAEQHAAGAVALAEVLGRFALNGVSHAFYWTYPKKPKPAYWAFRAFRNYDGAGGHFLEQIAPASAPSGSSLFASRDAAGKKWVIVALNFSSDHPFDASIALDGCVTPSGLRSFVYTGASDGLAPGDAKLEGAAIKARLPPYSIAVFEVATP